MVNHDLASKIYHDHCHGSMASNTGHSQVFEAMGYPYQNPWQVPC